MGAISDDQLYAELSKGISMMNIQVLDSSLVDKIAAGEVLERPAQLVKELVENSLDAGARMVEVEVGLNGREIRVTDDGSGIPSHQLSLALSRHATSKIRSAEDLFRLKSFGFRGEALSSVASVSRFSITSRTGEDERGTRLESVFGSEQKAEQVSSSVGTTILVSDLFENVPARLKFLKSDSSEIQHIKLCLKSFSLSRPDVSFRFLLRGNLEFFLEATEDINRRVEEVLNIAPLFETKNHENNIDVYAHFAAPNQTLRQNKGIWIFVQGRWIQDRAIAAAVMEGYRNLLMHGEYPYCVVKINMPPDQVDVNVHPTKSQVRFVNSSDVFRAVVHALRSGLEKTPWLAHSPLSSSKPSEVGDGLPTLESFTQTYFEQPSFSQTQYPKKNFSVQEPSSSYSANYKTEFPDHFPSMGDLKAAAFLWGDLQVIGQVAQTYIVAQSPVDFYLVDQHAAHERVVFERLMESWNNKRFSIQNFLMPLSVDFSESEVELLMTQKDAIAELGIEIEQLGPQTVGVLSCPEFIKESAVAQALHRFVGQLVQSGGSFALESAVADVFASMSCHSVVRAGQTLSVDEMSSLLKQMDEFPFSSFCPHGRPVFVKKSFAQIDREFGRTL